MRKAVLVALAVAAVAPVAAFALSYKTGTYKQGGQSGFKQSGIRITISSGAFNVGRILMPEVCSAPGQKTLHDFGGFQQDSSSKLAGTISSGGTLSGRFADGQGGSITIKGHISGNSLTVNGVEVSHYTPSGSTAHYTCRATGTFNPSLT
jgi:hypothetical protein